MELILTIINLIINRTYLHPKKEQISYSRKMSNFFQMNQQRMLMKMDSNRSNQLLIKKIHQKMLLKNMVMVSGWDFWLHIHRDYQMVKINHGTLFQDWHGTKNMIILEWEIELWLFGKDKDIIISQLAIQQTIIQIIFKIITTLKI